MSNHRSGLYAEAGRLLAEGLEALREGDQYHELWFIHDMARLKWLEGDYEEASCLAANSHSLARTLGDRVATSGSLDRLGEIAVAMGRYEEAREHFEDALAIAREMADPVIETESLVGLATIASAQGEHAEAKRLLVRGPNNARMIPPWVQCAVLEGLGYANRSLGRPDEAGTSFRNALSLAVGKGLRPRVLGAVVGFAHLVADEGNHMRALEYLDVVLQDSAAMQVTKDAARRLGDETEAISGPELAGAARARAGMMSLEEVVAELLAHRITHRKTGESNGCAHYVE
jgi:tetratricopeptide (TPR) repeat protein